MDKVKTTFTGGETGSNNDAGKTMFDSSKEALQSVQERAEAAKKDLKLDVETAKDMSDEAATNFSNKKNDKKNVAQFQEMTSNAKQGICDGAHSMAEATSNFFSGGKTGNEGESTGTTGKN